MNEIVMQYFNKRLACLLKNLLESLGTKFPILKRIASVVYQENVNRLDKAAPQECRFVRHLFKITFDDGVEIYSGSQQLRARNFPESFIRHLDQARRIVASDIATISQLEQTDLEVAIKTTQMQIEKIISGKFISGMLILEEYGSFIERFLAESLSLPAWLAERLDETSILAENFSHLQQQQNIEKNITLFEPLQKIDAAIFGRSPTIRTILEKIKRGGFLSEKVIRVAESIIKTHMSQDLFAKTEKAFPFLWCLAHEKIPFLKESKNFFYSLWEQVEMGKCLSQEQYNKYKSVFNECGYLDSWNALPVELKKTTADLVKMLEMFEEQEELTEEESCRYNRILDTLTRRGVMASLYFNKRKGELI